MSFVVTLTGSPSQSSRTLQLNDHVRKLLERDGFEVAALSVRELPAEDLLFANTDSPRLKEAFALIARADAVVVATPVYKAAYTGVLKAFLDLLPQGALANKVILPLAVGGTLAHALALDYALRPVLSTLGAQHVTSGLFLLDKQLERTPPGSLQIDRSRRAAPTRPRARRLHRRPPPAPPRPLPRTVTYESGDRTLGRK